jgi:hypothetical protein
VPSGKSPKIMEKYSTEIFGRDDGKMKVEQPKDETETDGERYVFLYALKPCKSGTVGRIYCRL